VLLAGREIADGVLAPSQEEGKSNVNARRAESESPSPSFARQISDVVVMLTSEATRCPFGRHASRPLRIRSGNAMRGSS